MLTVIPPITKSFLQPLLKNFRKTLINPEQTQQLVLKKIINNLAATEYGRALNIDTNDHYHIFAAKVPIVGYDDFSHWIDRQKATESRIITSEPVLFYEKTSGSSAAAKFIPYTRALKNSFNRLFLIWLADLL